MTEAKQQWLLGKDEERRLDLSQFYTPPDLAARMWEWCQIPDHRFERVLEPSAGRGSLIVPMLSGHTHPAFITAYDVDPRNVDRLQRFADPAFIGMEHRPTVEVRARDFIAVMDPGHFDLTVINPPYEDGQDIAHIDHALDHSDRVVCLVRSALIHGQTRWKKFWRHVEVRRRANLVERPEFSVPVDGKPPPGAKSDFVVLEVQRRRHARRQGEVTSQTEEFWSWKSE